MARSAGERDVDYFTFAARVGEVITCEVMAARIGSPLDPVIELRDMARGRRMAADEVRVGNNPSGPSAFRPMAIIRSRSPTSGLAAVRSMSIALLS